MSIIRNFWDLANCTSYSSHYVDQFDINTPYTGGGLFTWVENVGVVTTIPGIRIQNSANTNGYWIRADYQEGLKAEWFGVNRTTSTLLSQGIDQTEADNRYGVGLVTASTDTYDTAALRSMFAAANTLGVTRVVTQGTYRVNANIEIPKDIRLLKWDGGGCTIETTNTASYVVVSTELPTDNGDANVIVENIYNFDGIKIKGDVNQVGMQIGPSYGSRFQNMYYQDLSMGQRNIFCLGARFDNLRVTDCNVGVQLTSGFDDVDVVSYWTGAAAGTSQCNATSFNNVRAYHGTTGTTVIDILNADGITVRDFIVEGTYWQNGVRLWADLSTVRTIRISDVHYEVPNGMTNNNSGDALLWVRMQGGQAIIENVFGQTNIGKGALLVDVDQSSGGARTTIVLKDINWWVVCVTPSATPEVARNNGNAQWIIENCDNQLFTEATAISYILGNTPTACGGPGCGNNKYTFIPTPA